MSEEAKTTPANELILALERAVDSLSQMELVVMVSDVMVSAEMANRASLVGADDRATVLYLLKKMQRRADDFLKTIGQGIAKAEQLPPPRTILDGSQ